MLTPNDWRLKRIQFSFAVFCSNFDIQIYEYIVLTSGWWTLKHRYHHFDGVIKAIIWCLLLECFAFCYRLLYLNSLRPNHFRTQFSVFASHCHFTKELQKSDSNLNEKKKTGIPSSLYIYRLSYEVIILRDIYANYFEYWTLNEAKIKRPNLFVWLFELRRICIYLE